MAALNVFEAGMDIKLQATTQVASVNTTPDDSIVISIWGPDGVIDVTAQAMTNSATGVHYYWFSDPTDVGVYRWEVTAIHSVNSANRETIGEARFVVR